MLEPTLVIKQPYQIIDMVNFEQLASKPAYTEGSYVQ